MSLFKSEKSEQEQKLYELIKRNTELESQVKLFENTIDQLKRAFDKQEKKEDRISELEAENTQMNSLIKELKNKLTNYEVIVKEKDQITSDIQVLLSENRRLDNEFTDVSVKLQLSEQIKSNLESEITTLKLHNEDLSYVNKELLEKTDWIKTGAEKDDLTGYYGHGKYIKVKKIHLSEMPESITGAIVKFEDENEYPLSLMLYIWSQFQPARLPLSVKK